MSFGGRMAEIRDGFERPFWVANISELFERLSYYAAFASLARYLHETLSFPAAQAGSLTGFLADWCGFWPRSAERWRTAWDSAALFRWPILF